MTDLFNDTKSRHDQDSIANGSDNPITRVLTVLETHWQELRGADLLPDRTSIDSAKLDAALPYSFVLERVATGIACVRVSGQRVNAYAGMEMRGMPITALFSGTSRLRLSSLLEDCFGGPSIIGIAISTEGSLLHRSRNGRLLLLPLAGHGGQVTKALGAIVLDAPEGLKPQRFAIPEGEPVRRDLLGNGKIVRLEKGPAKRPALRLVVDNTRT